MNRHKFHIGQCFDAYEFFGAHVVDNGVIFRVYAPRAKAVSLIGEFSSWQELPMIQEGLSGIYELLVKDAKKGQMYKYKIHGENGYEMDHCDPYGFLMELRPSSASIITDLDEFKFTDDKWLKKRDKCFDKPLNIYEIHFGSWKRKSSKKDDWYTYSELGELLIPYLKDNGYNYVEFMPLSEHPADISWGYQNTGFFAPTSRYGTPQDLMKLINDLHNNDIGVIMDYVPVHFAIDDYGLHNFDGTALYEYPHTDTGVSEWGSYNFIHSRGEVASFLKSCANYWIEKYHFDGLRMDAVSRLIYWQGNKERGINDTALDFLRSMNSSLQKLHPSIILIAEDSTDFPKVTKPVEEGGLGFDYKWDMGWMNDTLNYFRKTPQERIDNYHVLTFSMMYFYSERFLLPLSHDENVHGKATILQKMQGLYEGKFPQARAFYMYMYTHPGKKLVFMGSEFAQIREFDEEKEQDFFMLKYPLHDSFNKYMKKLNHLYLDLTALHKGEYNIGTFKWIVVDDYLGSVYAYVRGTRKDKVFCIFNFSEKYHKDYYFKTDFEVKLVELLNSDWDIYSGTTKYEENKVITSIKQDKEIDEIQVYNEIKKIPVDSDKIELLDENAKITKTTIKGEEKYFVEVVEQKERKIKKTITENITVLNLPPYSGRLFRLTTSIDDIEKQPHKEIEKQPHKKDEHKTVKKNKKRK